MTHLHRLSVGAIAVAATGLLLILGPGDASAGPPPLPVLEPPFDQHYTITDLGPVDGLPPNYGGVAFAPSGLLLAGGNANDEDGQIYGVPPIRDGQGHITGFEAVITYPEAPYIDGGLTIGPGGVIFYSRYNPPNVEFGQILLSVPASAGIIATKVIDLAPLGVEESPGGLNFVPPGYPGAGSMKFTSYGDGDWYHVDLAPAGDGTYDATGASLRADLDAGSETLVYVPAGSPVLGTSPRVLINNYDNGTISAYEVDANGDPIPDSEEPFVTNIDGPDGAASDPVTGDLIVSDYSVNRMYRISGFESPLFLKGDNDCNRTIDAHDSLVGALFAVGADYGQGLGCTPLGNPVCTLRATSGEQPGSIVGDMNCDGAVNAFDALLILRYVADLPVNLPPHLPLGCLDIGDPQGAPL